MEPVLVALTVDDVDEVLALNRTAVPAVGDVDGNRMWLLLDWASIALGLRDKDGRLVAVVIVLRQGSDYDSANYRFFDQRYPTFVYVDRVMVAVDRQSEGLGARLYDEVLTRAGDAALMTAEVNLVPPNPGSLRFHERRGFRRVGVMESEDATYRVQYLAASLGPRTGVTPTGMRAGLLWALSPVVRRGTRCSG